MPRLRFLTMGLLFMLHGWNGWSARARLPAGCGEYEVTGKIRANAGSLSLIVYPGTISEVVLTLPESFRENATPHTDLPVTVTGTISHAIRKFRGSLMPRRIASALWSPLEGGVKNAFTPLKPVPCLEPERQAVRH